MSMDIKSINKTLTSYRQAMKRITEHFPLLEREGSGYAHFMGESFNSRYGNQDRKLASKLGASVASLTKYGKPDTQPGYWTWSSSFVKLRLYYVDSFDSCWHEFGCIDENGKRTKKAHTASHKQSLTVMFLEKSWGCGEWTKNRKAIVALAKKCQGNIKEEIMNDVLKSADREIELLKEAHEAQKAAIPQ